MLVSCLLRRQAFNDQLPKEKAELDLYPDELKKEIDDLNEWYVRTDRAVVFVHPYRSFFLPRRVYPSINNGVYRSGFATTQKAYEEAVTELFGALDRVEGILKDGREYLIGGKLTEADVRLYTTIVRFDIVYHGHFKCNLGSSEFGSFPLYIHLADRFPRHALIISYITLRYATLFFRCSPSRLSRSQPMVEEPLLEQRRLQGHYRFRDEQGALLLFSQTDQRVADRSYRSEIPR